MLPVLYGPFSATPLITCLSMAIVGIISPALTELELEMSALLELDFGVLLELESVPLELDFGALLELEGVLLELDATTLLELKALLLEDFSSLSFPLDLFSLDELLSELSLFELEEVFWLEEDSFLLELDDF